MEEVGTKDPQAALTHKVLDHGFVRLRNLSGPTRRLPVPEANDFRLFDADDVDPANSARMSFDQIDDDRPREADLKLDEYLIRNKHTTPLEMIECWIEMKLPIFVARQFVRHRTVTINEVSARYVKLPAEWYIPKPEHVGFRPKNVKQGRTQIPWDQMTDEQRNVVLAFLRALHDSCQYNYNLYEASLDNGIPPELARSLLHLNHYTHWMWKQDLHNIMHFLSLRVDSHAQWEAQQYGNAIVSLLRAQLPHLMLLFDMYRRQV